MNPKFSIQNQCCLLNPVTGTQMIGDRIHYGDFVAGEWYDTGNEVMGPAIVEALNNLDEVTRQRDALLESLKEAETVIRWAVQEASGRVKREHVGGWLHHADKIRDTLKSVEAK